LDFKSKKLSLKHELASRNFLAEFDKTERRQACYSTEARSGHRREPQGRSHEHESVGSFDAARLGNHNWSGVWADLYGQNIPGFFSNFEGVRVHFVTHPGARAADRNRLMREEDAISGLNMDLTFSTASVEGNVTTYGNVNVGGGVNSFRVVRVTGSALLSSHAPHALSCAAGGTSPNI
jgi:hypothetical protein